MRLYTEDQIARIWGVNFLRVFRDVEHVAQKAAESQGHHTLWDWARNDTAGPRQVLAG
jgi:hypothetical protein